jgi:hypothetical protein
MIRAKIKNKVKKVKRKSSVIPTTSILIEGYVGYLKPGKFGTWEKAYVCVTNSAICKWSAKPVRFSFLGTFSGGVLRISLVLFCSFS